MTEDEALEIIMSIPGPEIDEAVRERIETAKANKEIASINDLAKSIVFSSKEIEIINKCMHDEMSWEEGVERIKILRSKKQHV